MGEKDLRGRPLGRVTLSGPALQIHIPKKGGGWPLECTFYTGKRFDEEEAMTRRATLKESEGGVRRRKRNRYITERSGKK